jgi:hypothetical protein
MAWLAGAFWDWHLREDDQYADEFAQVRPTIVGVWNGPPGKGNPVPGTRSRTRSSVTDESLPGEEGELDDTLSDVSGCSGEGEDDIVALPGRSPPRRWSVQSREWSHLWEARLRQRAPLWINATLHPTTPGAVQISALHCSGIRQTFRSVMLRFPPGTAAMRGLLQAALQRHRGGSGEDADIVGDARRALAAPCAAPSPAIVTPTPVAPTDALFPEFLAAVPPRWRFSWPHMIRWIRDSSCDRKPPPTPQEQGKRALELKACRIPLFSAPPPVSVPGVRQRHRRANDLPTTDRSRRSRGLSAAVHSPSKPFTLRPRRNTADRPTLGLAESSDDDECNSEGEDVSRSRGHSQLALTPALDPMGPPEASLDALELPGRDDDASAHLADTFAQFMEDAEQDGLQSSNLERVSAVINASAPLRRFLADELSATIAWVERAGGSPVAVPPPTEGHEAVALATKVCTAPCIAGALCLRTVGEPSMLVAEARWPRIFPIVGGLLVRETSALARQLYRRGWEFSVLPGGVRSVLASALPLTSGSLVSGSPPPVSGAPLITQSHPLPGPRDSVPRLRRWEVPASRVARALFVFSLVLSMMLDVSLGIAASLAMTRPVLRCWLATIHPDLRPLAVRLLTYPLIPNGNYTSNKAPVAKTVSFVATPMGVEGPGPSWRPHEWLTLEPSCAAWTMTAWLVAEDSNGACAETRSLLLGLRWQDPGRWSWAGEHLAIGAVQNTALAAGWLHGRGLQEWIEWLTGEPAGMKLNAELGGFLGGVASDLVGLWQSVLEVLLALLGPWIILCALLTVLGSTFLLAALSDTLSLFSLHLWFLQRYVASLHGVVVGVVWALWLLFQGSKQNPLRLRVDSIDSSHQDAAQRLLVGTLLFACAVLLAPTVALFHIFFCIAWGACLAVTSVLWTARTILSDLPMAEAAARIFLPGVLPTSLHVVPPDPAAAQSDSLITSLRSSPAPLLSLFLPYFQAFRRLLRHYRSADMVGGVVYGRGIPGAPDEDEAMLQEEKARQQRETQQQYSSYAGDAPHSHQYLGTVPPSQEKSAADAPVADDGAGNMSPKWLKNLPSRAVQRLRQVISQGTKPPEKGSVLSRPSIFAFWLDCLNLWAEVAQGLGHLL